MGISQVKTWSWGLELRLGVWGKSMNLVFLPSDEQRVLTLPHHLRGMALFKSFESIIDL
jgi:hypothetical protein